MEVHFTHIDTACILLDINGFKILTDPTLDKAGALYHHGFGAVSRKTDDPVYDPADLRNVDMVLLSHHQHRDNFDHAGEAFSKTVSRVISTPAAARALPGVTGLNAWESVAINTAKVPGLVITATPAQHRPSWIPEFVSGKVTGFVLEWDAQQHGVLYISGDTVYFPGISEIARRFRIDTGIFHVGAVQFRYLSGFGEYTMSSKGLIKAVTVLNPNKVIPIHTRGWTHFKEKASTLKTTLMAATVTRNRTIFPASGVRTLI